MGLCSWGLDLCIVHLLLYLKFSLSKRKRIPWPFLDLFSLWVCSLVSGCEPLSCTARSDLWPCWRGLFPFLTRSSSSDVKSWFCQTDSRLAGKTWRLLTSLLFRAPCLCLRCVVEQVPRNPFRNTKGAEWMPQSSESWSHNSSSITDAWSEFDYTMLTALS